MGDGRRHRPGTSLVQLEALMRGDSFVVFPAEEASIQLFAAVHGGQRVSIAL